MVNTYAVQSGGCRFESLWSFGFFLKGAHYEVDYSGKNLLSWTAMHIDFVMCKKRHFPQSSRKLISSKVSKVTKRSPPRLGKLTETYLQKTYRKPQKLKFVENVFRKLSSKSFSSRGKPHSAENT